MQNFHPLFVHFPIALLLVAFFFELVSELTGKGKLKAAATYNLALGVLAAWAAVATGWWASRTVPQPEAVREIMERHELFAFITAIAATVLLAWHRSYKVEAGRWIKWGLFLLVAVFIALTGLLGGKLVFEHGVGGLFTS